MARYIDADALLNMLPDDLPYKASVKRVLMQAPTADVAPRAEVAEIFEEIETSLVIGGFVNGEKYIAIREDDYNHYKKKYTEESEDTE